jgi:hypothetical protein
VPDIEWFYLAGSKFVVRQIHAANPDWVPGPSAGPNHRKSLCGKLLITDDRTARAPIGDPGTPYCGRCVACARRRAQR